MIRLATPQIEIWPLVRTVTTCPVLRRLVSVATAVSLLIAPVSCASLGTYVWADDAPEAYFRPPPELLIATGDTVGIRVFGQEPLSVHEIVRSDGVIVMPLIGNVVVLGKSPEAVAKGVEARLQPYVTNPNVVVVVEESRIRVVAMGEVRHVGPILLESGDSGLLAALAAAGGITEFATESRVFVLRPQPQGIYRIRFKYDDIVRGVGRAAAFRLRAGDQLVVE